MVWSRALKVTAAWGENRQFNGFNGNADGYLLEWDLGASRSSTFYGRAEVADKELHGAGFHTRAFPHRHWFSTIDALTLGYVRDLVPAGNGRIGIGADVTVYGIPPDELPYFASSRSYHVFLHWRPTTAMHHVH